MFGPYLALALAAGPLAAQNFLLPSFGPSTRFTLSDSVQIATVESAARSKLENYRAYLANQQWDEAVETLREVQETYGEQVIALTPEKFVPLRTYAHFQLAALPAEALALYRERVDPRAEAWYRAGLATRDEALLRRVVDELFCSSSGDDALLALGEIALERGDHTTARRYWRQISPLLSTAEGLPARLAAVGVETDGLAETPEIIAPFQSREAAPTWLAYPDTDIDLAEVRARLVLVSILEGDRARANQELALFERLHPEAVGRLAGRERKLHEYLAALLSASGDWPIPAPPTDWETFAGGPRRNRVLEAPIEFSAQPTWTVELKSLREADDPFPEPAGLGRDTLAAGVHPIVADGVLFYSNGEQVFALDLASGKPAWSARDGQGQIYPGGFVTLPRAADPGSNIPQIGEARHTLTRHGNRLFARLGSPVTSRPTTDRPPPRSGSYLVCLDIGKQGALEWRYPQADAMAGFIAAGWALEGAPLADGRRVYVAMRRSDVRPQSHVACLDAATGELLWRRMIASADTPGGAQRAEITHNLLTLDEGILYCNTNLGAVAAVDARDGALRWIYQYQRARSGDLASPPAHMFRDLNPCLVAGDFIVVAPSDSGSIFALDAATGRLAWRTAPTSLPEAHPIHMLGVQGGYLVATGRNVWWIDVHSGRIEAVWPDFTGNAEVGTGRGLLAGGKIYWPTREQILVFDQQLARRGQPRLVDRVQLLRPDVPENITGGNLLAAEGFVVMTTDEAIYGYRQGDEFGVRNSEFGSEAAK